MSNFVEKKAVFKGMTLSQMKAAYSKMTPAERGKYAGAFVRAAKTAPKSKPISKSKPIPKSEQANTGTGRDGKFGTGTYGKGRPSGKSNVYKRLYKPGEMVGKDEKTNTKSIPVKNRRGRTTGSKEVPVTPKKKKTPKDRYNRRGRRF